MLNLFSYFSTNIFIISYEVNLLGKIYDGSLSSVYDLSKKLTIEQFCLLVLNYWDLIVESNPPPEKNDEAMASNCSNEVIVIHFLLSVNF